MIKLLEQSLQRLFDIQGREHFFSIKFVLNKLKKKRSCDLWPSLAGLTCIPLLPGSAGARLLQAPGTTSRQTVYGRYCLTVLFGAFLLILINPFLNYSLQQNFVQGWYQSFDFGSLWFVSPLEGLESLLITKSFYMPPLVGMMIPVLIALFLGRVFCSWVCPVTFVLEIFDRLRKFISKKRFLQNRLLLAKKYSGLH